MIAALLLAAAPTGVIEAKRAFAAAAKREGQWYAVFWDGARWGQAVLDHISSE